MAFWQELLKCMKSMDMSRSNGDPCLYFNWTNDHLVLIASWIDDNLIVGDEKSVSETKNKLIKRFECDDCGEIKEYIGCKIERRGSELKFTSDLCRQIYMAFKISPNYSSSWNDIKNGRGERTFERSGDHKVLVGSWKIHTYDAELKTRDQ